MGAVNPLGCRPATKMVLFQYPCGKSIRRRCPRAQRIPLELLTEVKGGTSKDAHYTATPNRVAMNSR